MSDHCCEHGLETRDLERRQRTVLVAVLAINVVTFVMMVAASLLSGSASILSGALDNFGDALTYALSFAAVGAGRVAKAKVALVKGALILLAAFAVGAQIIWRLLHFDVPVVETMSIAAALNLAANIACLWLLTPHRGEDVNMASVWECSRNDVLDGVAVIVATAGVWLLASPWPDIVVAAGLMMVFARSGTRVLASALGELRVTTSG